MLNDLPLEILEETIALLEKYQEMRGWKKKARENQKPPSGIWRIWLVLAGRGFGKTRMGAETVHEWALGAPKQRLCLLGQDLNETRRTMVEGESGVLNTGEIKPEYISSQRKLIWPNGSQAFLFSADAYEQLRGPQFHAAWVDELAKFPHAKPAWDQLMMGLRLGKNPRVMVTTTPRPIPLLNTLLARPDVQVTRGTTWDNAANLPPGYLEELRQQYGDTVLGLQELDGHMVESAGGLWKPETVLAARRPRPFCRSDYICLVVALDPAVSYGEGSAETGILVVGKTHDNQIHVIDDQSGRLSPTAWIGRAVSLFERYQATRLVAEVNNGGDLIEALLRTMGSTVPYEAVRAAKGKTARAEPIAALYEQGHVAHIRPFPELEAQLLAGGHGGSDRMDALVWGVHSAWKTSETRIWMV